jgi:hypothetical protein
MFLCENNRSVRVKACSWLTVAHLIIWKREHVLESNVRSSDWLLRTAESIIDETDELVNWNTVFTSLNCDTIVLDQCLEAW